MRNGPIISHEQQVALEGSPELRLILKKLTYDWKYLEHEFILFDSQK